MWQMMWRWLTPLLPLFGLWTLFRVEEATPFGLILLTGYFIACGVLAYMAWRRPPIWAAMLIKHPDSGFGIAALIAVMLGSYWSGLVLANFSSNPIQWGTEPYFPLTVGLGVVVGLWLLRLLPVVQGVSANPLRDPLSQAKTFRGILADEWRVCWPDMRWVLLGTTALFILLGLGWRVGYASDGSAYLRHYLQLNDAQPVYYSMQAYITPLSGLFYGGLLDIGGVGLLKAGQFVQALSAAAALFWLARPFGRGVAWLLIGLWWLQLDSQVQFHLVGNDPLSIWLFPIWLLCLRWVASYNLPAFWFLLGVLAGVNTLSRPGYLLLIVGIAIVVFLVSWRGWRGGILRIGWAVAGLLLLILPLIFYNGERFGFYSFSRGSNFVLFAAVYGQGLVEPVSLIELDNGPATRQFADLIEQHLLTTETYQGVTIEAFLSTPSSRTWDDSLSVVDQHIGWDTDYALLNEVGWEAVRAHPGRFLLTRLQNTLSVLGAKSRLPETFQEYEQTSEVVYLVERPNATWHLSQPDNSLPSPEAITASQEALRNFSRPITEATPQTDLINPIGDVWQRFGPHPLLVLLVWPFALLLYRGQSLAFLLFGMGVAMAVVLPSAMVAAETRYRLPLHPVYLLAVAAFIYRLPAVWARYAPTPESPS